MKRELIAAFVIVVPGWIRLVVYLFNLLFG
jgi:hypothetical protein